MNTEMVLQEFRELLSYEERAKYFYDHYIDYVENKEIKDQLTAIRDDEIRHVEIVKKLIAYVA